MSHSLPFTWCQEEKHPLPRFHTWVQEFWGPPVLPSHFNYLTGRSETICFLINLLIHFSIAIVDEQFSYVKLSVPFNQTCKIKMLHAHIRTHTQTHKHTHTHIYIYLYMNVYIYIYIYIYPVSVRRQCLWIIFTCAHIQIFFQVQSWLQASDNTGIPNTCTQLWLTESEQVPPVDSMKDVVWSSVKVPEFDKHLKKAGGHIGRNVVELTIKMKTIVRKTIMIKIIKLRLRNLDN